MAFSHTHANSLDQVEKNDGTNGTPCWFVVNDKVYNGTPFLEDHPGGDCISLKSPRHLPELSPHPSHISTQSHHTSLPASPVLPWPSLAFSDLDARLVAY